MRVDVRLSPPGLFLCPNPGEEVIFMKSVSELSEGLVVYEFPSGDDEVRGVLQIYRGSVWAHVRRYYFTRDGEARPGKGLAVRVEQLPQLLAAVEALIEAAEAELAR
jgi:hypothetical protein